MLWEHRRETPAFAQGRFELSLVNGDGLRLVGEGQLGERPRGEKMENSRNGKHFMLGGAECNTGMARKEDEEIDRS